MTLAAITKAFRTAWDTLTVSRYTLALERENAELRTRVRFLEMQRDAQILPFIPMHAAPGRIDTSMVMDAAATARETKAVAVTGPRFYDEAWRSELRTKLFAAEEKAAAERDSTEVVVETPAPPAQEPEHVHS